MGTPLALVLLLSVADPLWAGGRSSARKEPSIGINQFGPETRPSTDGNNAFHSVSPPESRAAQRARKPSVKPRGERISPATERLAQVESGGSRKAEGGKPQAPVDEESSHFSSQQFYDGALKRPAQAEKEPGPRPRESDAADEQPEEVFVTVDLDLKANPDQYKDAVASLGRVAAFRPDPRFAPTVPSSDRISFWGWMPADRVSEALSVSGVMRLHFDRSRSWTALSLPDPATGKFLVSIRVADAAEAASAAQKVVEDLAELGFRPLRSLGAEPSAGGALVRVEGLLPVRALSLVLGHSQVSGVSPVQAEPASSPAPAARKKASPREFLHYATERAPFLLVLTLLLLLLPRLAGGWEKLCEIFVPYRR